MGMGKAMSVMDYGFSEIPLHMLRLMNNILTANQLL
jgi:hypothetical protein